MADGCSGFLPFSRELVVDLFAGGGGASLGLSRAYRDQVRLIGNSVCPDVAEAIARANLADLIELYARAA